MSKPQYGPPIVTPLMPDDFADLTPAEQAEYEALVTEVGDATRRKERNVPLYPNYEPLNPPDVQCDTPSVIGGTSTQLGSTK